MMNGKYFGPFQEAKKMQLGKTPFSLLSRFLIKIKKVTCHFLNENIELLEGPDLWEFSCYLRLELFLFNLYLRTEKIFIQRKFLMGQRIIFFFKQKNVK